MSMLKCPTSVEMRKPIPTVGVPKNSATIAPIIAKVALILSALKTNGKAARRRHFISGCQYAHRRAGGRPHLQRPLPIAGGVAPHEVAPRTTSPEDPRRGVHQHREEGH